MGGSASVTDDMLSHLFHLVSQDPLAALELINKYQKSLGHDEHFAFNVGGLLIDTGCALNDLSIVMRGIESIQQIINNISDVNRARLLYNLGNGWYAIDNLSRLQSNRSFHPDTTELNEAKRCYREAIKAKDRLPRYLCAQLFVNYGNCLAHFGRSLEAIAAYENALSIAKNHPMAWGNLGIELAHFAPIAGDYAVIRDAYYALTTALEGSLLEEMGERSAKLDFQHTKDRIEQQLRANSQDDYGQIKPAKSRSDRQKSYFHFCEKYQLFLNLSAINRPSKYAAEDNVGLTIITDVNDETTFLKLSRIINDIKERFAVARLLLFEALEKTSVGLSIEEMTHYTDNLDYGVYGIRAAKLKLALESAYNILDKIAFFINDYLHLGLPERNIYFGSIWIDRKTKNHLRADILQTGNRHLYGLYDLSRDLAKSGYFGHLAELRHSSTHRYLIPHVEEMHWETEIDGPNYHVTMWELKERAVELLQLVRNAIIYLIAFIHDQEIKKESITKGPIVPMFATPYLHKLFNQALGY